MMSVLSWAVPVAMYLVAWRVVFRLVVSDPLRGGYRVEGDDVLMAALMATVSAIFAPFVLAGGIVWFLLGRNPAQVARRLGGESRATKIERLECEARERESRIADLERRLDIGGPRW